ncbi:hypothetical protein RO3G_12502 [Rhizopus delemar RA 99-880]|uniref:Uncharacterized protein n=1 Tax=Rhizopus delemar (strain RA 99-880 / ATCC MYA-4621 / FGSC 9543 / NRRL 43880) TaxID=246409 RepID=I1CH61_RHIO9|nr:hypothetical protein RO3G_12502 [Rhizopus delemar RA 99-880]|eukprot:EIE87791.1 hypothetical protein RO3G_12502 [Rhizopus delemar RA 99-880]
MSLRPVGLAGEENCLAIAVRLDWELSHSGLATLGGEVEALLGDEEHLDGMEGLQGGNETVGDMVRSDREGGMFVVGSFGASCFQSDGKSVKQT